MLTFTSDGTFFRSGDTHPVLSVAHGVWAPVGDGQFDATYTALRFDENRAYLGSNRTRIRITLGPDVDQFTGLVKATMLAPDGSVQGTGQGQLQGKRMTVESFDA